MKTLHEMETEREAARDRAWRFQQVTESLNRARKDVERLTPHVAGLKCLLVQLDAIDALAATLPANIVSTGGAGARDVIAGACAKGRASVSNKLTKEQRALDAATEEIPRLNALRATIQQS
jgi:hypothetical protein